MPRKFANEEARVAAKKRHNKKARDKLRLKEQGILSPTKIYQTLNHDEPDRSGEEVFGDQNASVRLSRAGYSNIGSGCSRATIRRIRL